jgi:transcriptional regulator with XRE-family HTH domain
VKTIYDDRYRMLIKRLRSRRLELGLTQERVARQLKVPRTWPGKIEQCERRLDLLEAWNLCRLYGISLSEIDRILSADDERP